MKTRERHLKIRERHRLDDFIVRYFSGEDPLASGDGGLEGILDIVERHMGELMPDRMRVSSHRERRYSRAVAMKQFATRETLRGVSNVSLSKDDDAAGLWVYLPLRSVPHWKNPFQFDLHVTPFDFYRDAVRGQARSQQLLTFVREMARCFPPSYAYGHSYTDESMGREVDPEQPIPEKVEEVYWLNIYGSKMVESLGRERVLSTPAVHLEELPHGGVLYLTRPTPGDFASDEARMAQARALAHLNPEFSLDSALARQRERSAYLAPVEQKWDPDLVELLEYTLDMKAARKDVPRETARLNAWRPPPVSEWMPLAEAPPCDAEDGGRAMLSYISIYAEGLQLMYEKEVPEVMKADPASLIPLDQYFWHFNYPECATPEQLKEKFMPMVGAYLGELLVKHLGGRWVARRKRDECYVVLGDRAWLPFLRARHYLQSQQSVLDHSLTKFYREAERYVRGR